MQITETRRKSSGSSDSFGSSDSSGSSKFSGSCSSAAPGKQTHHHSSDIAELKPPVEAALPLTSGGSRQNAGPSEPCFQTKSTFLTIRDDALNNDDALDAVLQDGLVVTCHTNCGRKAQGTAFLQPELQKGHCYRIVVRIDNKPGRMCYFFGISRRLFKNNAGQALIRKSSYSLENLYDTLHEEGASGKRGRPCFHTGSVVTTTVDLIHDRVHFHVDSTGIERTAKLPPSLKWQFFVSLYNREASFTLLEMTEVDDSLL